MIEHDSAIDANYVEFKDLREAMADHVRAVVARLEDQYSWLGGDRGIGTWCRFRVLSALSAPSAAHVLPLARYDAEARPERFLPLSSSDVLVMQSGGTIMIVGVVVVERDRARPAFRRGETYLLFLALSAENVGGVAFFPGGAYLVSGPDALVPVTRSAGHLQKEIDALSGGSLSRLRGALESGGYGR